MPFNNIGTVQVLGGRLKLGSNTTTTGTYAVPSGTVLEFGWATHNLNAGAFLGGLDGAVGTVEVGYGSTFNFNSGASLDLAGGSFLVSNGAPPSTPAPSPCLTSPSTAPWRDPATSPCWAP